MAIDSRPNESTHIWLKLSGGVVCAIVVVCAAAWVVTNRQVAPDAPVDGVYDTHTVTPVGDGVTIRLKERPKAGEKFSVGSGSVVITPIEEPTGKTK